MNEPKEKPFSYREYFEDMVFREPRRGMSERAGYIMAALGVAAGLLWISKEIFFDDFGMGAPQILLGVAFIVMFSGGLLPKDPTKLAGHLRISAFAICFVALVLLVHNVGGMVFF